MTEQDLRRVAFVTRHYTDLRAGVLCAFLAPYALAVMLLEWVRWSFFLEWKGTSVVVMLTVILGVIPAYFLVERWMNRRFGRVRSVDFQKPRGGSVLWMVGWIVASRVDENYGFGAGVPSATLLVAAACGLWLTRRLWPVSSHYLLPTVVALGFALAFVRVESKEALHVWQFNAYGWTLITWAVAGFRDVMLLTRALPSRRVSESAVDAP